MQQSKSPSWSVVSTTKEAPEHVRAFVAWHLGAGAARITVYYDDPQDRGFGQFAHLPQVIEVRCDEAYWQKTAGRRFKAIGRRQFANATRSYQAAETDWQLHCDIDEFVYCERPVSQLLATLPDTCDIAQLRPVERIFLEGEEGRPFSDTFRHPVKEDSPRWLRKIYAYPEQIFRGLRGHRSGKLFVRTGDPAKTIRNHDVLLASGSPGDPACYHRFPDQQARLLHLYTYGEAHFLEKGRWKFARNEKRKARDNAEPSRTQEQKRRKITAGIFETGTDAQRRALFRDCFVFTKPRLRKLKKYQRVETVDFTAQLQVRLARYFSRS